MSAILSIQSVTQRYRSRGGQGEVEALRGIDLEVGRGEFISFVGPSGCGKSTLLNIIGGLLTATRGQVMFQGEPMLAPSRDMGIMFQKPVLLPWRTVEKNVLLPAEVFDTPRDEVRDRVREAIRMVGLGEFLNALPQHLSGGMQQRVALARVLAYRPKVLLMDEPFGALDEFTREAMNLELINITKPSGITVVFVTHNIPEAIFLSDRVVVMSPRPGRILGVVDVPFPGLRTIEIMRDSRFTELAFRVRELLKMDTADAEAPLLAADKAGGGRGR